MCLPEECHNKKDLKLIVKKLKDVLNKVMAKEGMKVGLEIDCSASGGAEKGAGGDREITVDDDYITDAQPLPKHANVPTKRPPSKPGPKKYRSSVAALTPGSVAVFTMIVGLALSS